MSRRGWVLGEAGRFMVVGAVSTLSAAASFNLLVHGDGTHVGVLAGHVYVGYVLANTLGMVLSYQGSRRWVFRRRATAHADGGVSAYVVINLSTMALPVACLWVSRAVLGLSDPVADNVAANVVGLMAGTWVRFWLFRQFVFNEVTPAPSAGPSRVVSLRRAVRSRPQVGPLVAELGDEVA